jgi:hypothetical protein
VKRGGTPGTVGEIIQSPPEQPTVESSRFTFCNRNRYGRFAGSIVFDDFDPGVSLRFTPGFMLAAASRANLAQS